MPRLQIQRLTSDSDPHTRAYFSRTELTQKKEIIIRGDRRPRNGVLSIVIEIPGIAMAAVQPYALTITKAPTYEWTEIEPQLLLLLSAFNIGEGSLVAETKEGS